MLMATEVLPTLLMVALIVSSSFGFVSKGMRSGRSQINVVGNQLRALPADEQYFVDLFNEAKGNVAYVSSIDRAFNPLTFNVLEVPSQSGSGWVWADGKHIVTNYHVVAARRPNSQSIVNSSVLVTFIDDESQRTSYKAKVVGGDASRDIALLKVIPENGTTTDISLGTDKGTQLGSSSDLQVGQRAIAIGSPFGLDHSVTTGIISGLGRRLGVSSVEESENQEQRRGNNNAEPLNSQVRPGTRNYDMIQTDAAINPGNSGGPLLDSSGRVIGMNTAIFSTSGAFAGVGFAIPIDTIRTVVDLLLSSGNGAVAQPKTGLQLAGGTTARALQAKKGLVVLGVEAGSAAAQAGLRAMPPLSLNIFTALQNRQRASGKDGEVGAGTSTSSSIPLGDIITAVDDKQVNTEADFLAALASNQVDDTVGLTIERSVGQERREVQINLKLSK